MKWKDPIEEGQFLRRYKRFFADIEWEGEQITAHVPNTGSLKTCLYDNAKCLFTRNDDPKRKLKFTLQMIKTPTSWVGVNTQLTNDLVWEAFQNKEVKHWSKYKYGRREVKVSDETRFDLALCYDELEVNPKKKIPYEKFDEHKFRFVEVKNVTMAEDGIAVFPDAKTTRGQKHLIELMGWVEKGHESEIFFVVQRTDCDVFQPAKDIDPEYARLLNEAKKAGVKLSAYACKMQKSQIVLDTKKALKIQL